MSQEVSSSTTLHGVIRCPAGVRKFDRYVNPHASSVRRLGIIYSQADNVIRVI